MFAKDFNDREKQCLIELLVIMSSVDGDLSMEEMDQLDISLEEMGMKTLPATIRPLKDIAEELSSSAERTLHEILFELSQFSRADSRIHSSETALLQNLAKLLNLSREKLLQIEEAAEKMPLDRDTISAMLA